VAGCADDVEMSLRDLAYPSAAALAVSRSSHRPSASASSANPATTSSGFSALIQAMTGHPQPRRTLSACSAHCAYGDLASSTPQVLSIIGIVCWFCCSPAAIVLGLIAQNQFRNEGRPDTIARVAWIGGIVAMVLGILSFIIRLAAFNRTGSSY
jgi:hypothetical protein